MNFLTDIILPLRTEALNQFFLIFTKLGSWEMIVFLSICVAGLFYFYKKKDLILPLFLAVLGSGATSLVLKYLVDRPRPLSSLALAVENSPSFPSAHATLILAFFGFLIYCVWKFNWKRYVKIIITLVFCIIMVFIGFSRLYLGVHYLSDVLAGYLVAFPWISMAVYISRYIFSNEK